MLTPRLLPRPRRALIAGLAAGALLTTGASAIAAPGTSAPKAQPAAHSQVTAKAPAAKITCDNPNISIAGTVTASFYRTPGKNRAAGARIRIPDLTVTKNAGGPERNFVKGIYTITTRAHVLMQGKADATPVASKARTNTHRMRANGKGNVVWKLRPTVLKPEVPRMRDAFAQPMIAGAASVSITFRGPNGLRANCSATQAVGAATTWA